MDRRSQDSFHFNKYHASWNTTQTTLHEPSPIVPAWGVGCRECAHRHDSWYHNPADANSTAHILPRLQTQLNHSHVDSTDEWPLTATPAMPPKARAVIGQTAPPPKSPSSDMSQLHEIAFIVIVCSAQFLALGGLAQTVAPLFIIGDYLNVADPGELSWYTAAFSLTVGAFILPAGRIGDIYGHKKVFIVGWGWYAACSIITGFSYIPRPLASASVMFNVCRALQGIGPALCVPNAMALIGTTFPMGMKKNIVFSLFGAMGPTGFVMGALFSSIIAQFGWWPWAFWALAILCTFIGAASFLIIPARTSKPTATTSTFDFMGTFIGVSGLVLINFAFNQAPVVGWGVSYIPFTLGIGIGLMIFFVYVEFTTKRQPLIPFKGIRKEAGFALACIAAGWSSHGIWLYYFFQFVHFFRHASALSSASQLVPVAILGPACALSTGFLMKKMRVAWIMLMAMVCFFVGTLFLAIAPPTQPYLILTFWSVLVMPGGMNWSFPSGTILLSNAMPKEHQGMSASLVSTVVNYSISTGLGIAGTINRYTSESHGTLAGLRGGWYFAMGLDALGIAIAGWFVWKSRKQ